MLPQPKRLTRTRHNRIVSSTSQPDHLEMTNRREKGEGMKSPPLLELDVAADGSPADLFGSSLVTCYEVHIWSIPCGKVVSAGSLRIGKNTMILSSSSPSSEGGSKRDQWAISSEVLKHRAGIQAMYFTDTRNVCVYDTGVNDTVQPLIPLFRLASPADEPTAVTEIVTQLGIPSMAVIPCQHEIIGFPTTSVNHPNENHHHRSSPSYYDSEIRREFSMDNITPQDAMNQVRHSKPEIVWWVVDPTPKHSTSRWSLQEKVSVLQFHLERLAPIDVIQNAPRGDWETVYVASYAKHLLHCLSGGSLPLHDESSFKTCPLAAWPPSSTQTSVVVPCEKIVQSTTPLFLLHHAAHCVAFRYKESNQHNPHNLWQEWYDGIMLSLTHTLTTLLRHHCDQERVWVRIAPLLISSIRRLSERLRVPSPSVAMIVKCHVQLLWVEGKVAHNYRCCPALHHSLVKSIERSHNTQNLIHPMFWIEPSDSLDAIRHVVRLVSIAQSPKSFFSKNLVNLESHLQGHTLQIHNIAVGPHSLENVSYMEREEQWWEHWTEYYEEKHDPSVSFGNFPGEASSSSTLLMDPLCVEATVAWEENVLIPADRKPNYCTSSNALLGWKSLTQKPKFPYYDTVQFGLEVMMDPFSIGRVLEDVATKCPRESLLTLNLVASRNNNTSGMGNHNTSTQQSPGNGISGGGGSNGHNHGHHDNPVVYARNHQTSLLNISQVYADM
eukprot:PhF_6_TR26420/c0_g2_i1/m.38220